MDLSHEVFGIKRLVILALIVVSTQGYVWTDELNSHAPVSVATGAERLLVEQVEELVRSGSFAEAIETLEQLFEQSESHLIEAEGLQRAATQKTLRYIPVRHWVQARLATLLNENPALGVNYSRDREATSKAALEEMVNGHKISQARQAAERFSQTRSGPALHLVVADLYLERGDGLAALQTLQRLLPALRFPIRSAGAATNGSLPWTLAFEQIDASEREAALRAWYTQAKGQFADDAADALLVDILVRVIDATALCPQATDRSRLTGWLSAVANILPGDGGKRIRERLVATENWSVATGQDSKRSSWRMFAGNHARNESCSERFDPEGWPTWNATLERYNGSSDRIVASKPRVAELENGLLGYHPVVDEQRVYVNELSRIVAYDLGSGHAWPSSSPVVPLFDSHITPSAYMPLGYPMVGVPRGTVTLYGDCLYARMGSPVTGWLNGEGSRDGTSIGYIVGLDLKRQGSLLRGFPLYLTQAEFGGAEPEGCPLVVGDRMFVAIAKRDNVGLRRFIAAFDRFNGQLLWKSPTLASATVEGSDRANVLAHQLLSYCGGRLYYNTNLGSVACLDPASGQVEWLVRYRRVDKVQQAYPQPDRFRYRDLTPCLVDSGLIYCAPQDCPEIFALDAVTGDLVWSTDDSAVADAIYLLGTAGRHLIVSGDRLIWLDRLTGMLHGRFPAATTSGTTTALPSPRGLGRGCLSGGEVYWPTINEILVFDAAGENASPSGNGQTVATASRAPWQGSPHADAVPIRRRIRLDIRGAEGGNLVAVDGWLLIATPSRLLAFAEPPIAK